MARRQLLPPPRARWETPPRSLPWHLRPLCGPVTLTCSQALRPASCLSRRLRPRCWPGPGRHLADSNSSHTGLPHCGPQPLPAATSRPSTLGLVGPWPEQAGLHGHTAPRTGGSPSLTGHLAAMGQAEAGAKPGVPLSPQIMAPHASPREFPLLWPARPLVGWRRQSSAHQLPGRLGGAAGRVGKSGVARGPWAGMTSPSLQPESQGDNRSCGSAGRAGLSLAPHTFTGTCTSSL